MRPTITSVELDYRRTGYRAAQQIDRMLSGRETSPEPLACGVRTIVDCGFSSLSRLKVLFQKTFGMTMREWRKTHS